MTFVEREDNAVGVSASLVYRPTRNITLSGSLSYEDQDSTFFLSEFDAFDSGLNLNYRHAF